MATSIVANQLLEAKVFTQNFAQQGINVLHFNVASVAGGVVNDSALCSAMDAILAPLYKAYLPTVCSYRGMRLQIISAVPIPVAVKSQGNAGAGTVAQDPLPSQASGLVTKLSNTGGRTGRGRLYLPFWPEGTNDASGYPSAAAQVQMDAISAVIFVSWAVVIGGVTVTLTPVLYNRTTKVTINITSWTPRSRWATQRRRSEINRADTIGP